MKSTVVSIVGMVAAVGTLAGVGQADTPSGVDVQAELAQLRAKVAHLEAQAGESWLTEQRAEEIRGLVQDVLADADTRGSLLQNGMTAGHDGKHFFLGSADGNFYLELSGQMQVRFIYNNQDNSSDDNRWGFENPRTKLNFKGHVVNPDWMYEICGCFSGCSGTFGLGTAYIAHKMGDGWKLQFGQFKPPFLYEELVSSKYQQLVDRSLVNEEFNQDYAQGIQLSYEGDMFRFWAMYHDGFESRNRAWSVEDTEFALTGRVEFLFSGNWGQFKDYNGWPGQEEVGFLVGVAGHYQQDEFGTGDAMFFDRMAESASVVYFSASPIATR